MTEEHEDGDAGRVTAPQQDYGMNDVIKGLLVMGIGLAITMGLPLVLV